MLTQSQVNGLYTEVNTPNISIISPVFMGEQTARALAMQVNKALTEAGFSYELILVEDASPDGSWEIIKEIAKDDKRIKGIRLSRNFGQHYAILAGLEEASAPWISIVDCDLQDNPFEIPRLYHKAQEGFDIVYARRVNRKDGPWKRLTSIAFNAIFSFFVDQSIVHGVGNFGIYSKRAVEHMRGAGETMMYFPAMISRVGYDKAIVDVEHKCRASGKSTYSLSKLLRLGFRNIIGFSEKPLRLIAILGFGISVLSCLTGVTYAILYFFGIIQVAGFTSIMISLWLTFGVNIFMLGVVGIYIGKCLEGTKLKPLYIVRERI